MNYQEKYLKYKNKYLKLKEKITGGRLYGLEEIEIKKNRNTTFEKSYILPKDCEDQEKFNNISTLCIGQNTVLTDSNKFIILLNLLSEHDYKESLINILYYTKIPLHNVYGIYSQKALSYLNELHGYEISEYSDNLYLNSTKVDNIRNLSTIIDNIINKIEKNKLINCSITIHISSHGNIRVNTDNFVTITGHTYTGYINFDDFINILLPLYSTNNSELTTSKIISKQNIKIENINIITDFCYSSLNIKHKLENFIKTNKIEYHNTIFITGKPIIYPHFILMLFLETNPQNIDDYNKFVTKQNNNYNIVLQKAEKYNFNKELVDKSINILDSIIIKQKEWESKITFMIGIQNKNKFNNDRYNDIIYSNKLLSLYEEGSPNRILNYFCRTILRDNYDKKLTEINNLIIKHQLENMNDFDNNLLTNLFLLSLSDKDLADELIYHIIKESIELFNPEYFISFNSDIKWFDNKIIKDIF